MDKAESEPELAYAINAAAPEIFAEEAKAIGTAVIHYSTDYVFDGSKKTPWVELDLTGPLNVYGKSKLAGEPALSERTRRPVGVAQRSLQQSGRLAQGQGRIWKPCTW